MFDFEDPIVLRQYAELDQPDGDGIHKLVHIPVLQRRDENFFKG